MYHRYLTRRFVTCSIFPRFPNKTELQSGPGC